MTDTLIIRTPAELSALVAETREPRPRHCDVWQLASDGGEWQRSFGMTWRPRHRYAEDIAAAKRLQAEMVADCRGEIAIFARHDSIVGHWRFWAAPGIRYAVHADTEPIALCLLWLAWRGVAVEWRPESEVN